MTLDDVAAHAGVHAATVSRALSRPEMLTAGTLDRVRAAVDELGYVPNVAARQLAGGRTSRLAIIVPDVANPFFGGLVQAAQRRASDDDELVLLADTDQRPAREIDAVRSFAGDVDGIVLCASVAPVASIREAAGSTPLVSVNRRVRAVPSVLLDQSAVIDLGVDHLRSLGHERIAFVRGPAAYWSTEVRTRRADSLDVATLAAPAPTYEGGRETFVAVRDSGVTAVLAFNDLLAFGIMAAADEAGVSIPAELSVVGSDDVDIAEMVRPALTTVSGRMSDLGTTAVDVLLRHVVHGEEPPSSDIELAPELIVRASTAPV